MLSSLSVKLIFTRTPELGFFQIWSWADFEPAVDSYFNIPLYNNTMTELAILVIARGFLSEAAWRK